MNLDQYIAIQASTSDLAKGRHDTILLADDDVIFRATLQMWLGEWGYQVDVAEDGIRAWEILQCEPAPELIILDWIMPGISGLDICRRVRDRRRSPYQYILLVTANGSPQNVVVGLDAGADDYLTKPCARDELRSRLQVGQRILRLQKDLMNAHAALHHRATHDGLTGLWNRAAILDILRRELQRSSRARTPTGVLMLDLDRFKRVNDSFGHLIGDAVLREVAQRITAVVREYDSIGRYGGEEFIVILPNCGHADLRRSAERIRLAVAITPVIADTAEVPITVSIGAAIASPGAPSEERAIAAADTALYQAKAAGRNRTEICSTLHSTAHAK